VARKGYIANTLTPNVGDSNSQTPEYGNRANKAALAADFHPVTISDTFAFRQPFADFDKLFRLRNRIEQRVLGTLRADGNAAWHQPAAPQCGLQPGGAFIRR
jgi:hypothetical protein